MIFNATDFGEKVKYFRQINNLSQKEVADYLGVSTAQISDIEKGKSSPSLKRAVLLSDFLGVSLDYLVGISASNSDINVLFNTLSCDERKKVLEYIEFIKSR